MNGHPFDGMISKSRLRYAEHQLQIFLGGNFVEMTWT